VSQSLTSARLREALSVAVCLDGRPWQIEMVVPTVEDVVPGARAPGREAAEDLPYLVLDVIDTIDGDIPGLDDAVAICQDARALSTILSARNRLWDELRLHGRVFALCPHCELRESSFGLVTLALALSAAPPPLFGRGGLFPCVPTLADPSAPGRRFPGIPLAARLRLSLPSGALGLQPSASEAVLRDLDTVADDALGREERAWARWAPDGAMPPADHAHRFRGNAGFRSILRLGVALRSLDGTTDLTPEIVEALSIADFFFLDACYHLTHDVDQPRPDLLVVNCERCGNPYLPLA
jgi:hypothetical protein